MCRAKFFRCCCSLPSYAQFSSHVSTFVSKQTLMRSKDNFRHHVSSFDLMTFDEMLPLASKFVSQILSKFGIFIELNL